jgi:hypothetical protein
MTATTKTFTCPHCEDKLLKVESKDGIALGLLDVAPEGDVDGPYFPMNNTHVVYCDDCGEVTATELFDAIWGE